MKEEETGVAYFNRRNKGGLIAVDVTTGDAYVMRRVSLDKVVKGFVSGTLRARDVTDETAMEMLGAARAQRDLT